MARLGRVLVPRQQPRSFRGTTPHRTRQSRKCLKFEKIKDWIWIEFGPLRNSLGFSLTCSDFTFLHFHSKVSKVYFSAFGPKCENSMITERKSRSLGTDPGLNLIAQNGARRIGLRIWHEWTGPIYVQDRRFFAHCQRFFFNFWRNCNYECQLCIPAGVFSRANTYSCTTSSICTFDQMLPPLPTCLTTPLFWACFTSRGNWTLLLPAT